MDGTSSESALLSLFDRDFPRTASFPYFEQARAESFEMKKFEPFLIKIFVKVSETLIHNE